MFQQAIVLADLNLAVRTPTTKLSNLILLLVCIKFRDLKIHDLAGINFSDFIILSSVTYQVLCGLPTISSINEPSQKADFKFQDWLY